MAWNVTCRQLITRILGHHSKPLRCSNANIRRQIHITTTATDKDSVVDSVESDNTASVLHVRWSDGQTARYPYVWLQDSCQSEERFHPVSKARLMLMQNLKLDNNIKDVHIDKNSRKVTITWEDGHSSPLGFAWLRARQFQNNDSQVRNPELKRKQPKLWGRDLVMQEFSFHDLMSKDETLYDWLVGMEEDGITLVRDTPLDVGQVERIIHRVGNIRETNYGSTFRVEAKPDPSNVAYTTSSLGLHTDLPYYEAIPGIQLLHCIKQTHTEGGDNQFADGFHVAEVMKVKHNDYFRFLTNTPVCFVDIGEDSFPFFMQQDHTTFRTDASGAVDRIVYNNQTRDTYVTSRLDDVHYLFEALKMFDDLLYDDSNVYHIKLREGDTVIFDNCRVLHGRQGYQMTQDSSRLLEGAYIDWDTMLSRRRRIILDGGLDYCN